MASDLPHGPLKLSVQEYCFSDVTSIKPHRNAFVNTKRNFFQLAISLDSESTIRLTYTVTYVTRGAVYDVIVP